MNLHALESFHKNRLGHLVFGLVELGLAYAVSLRAIDNGNLLLWALVLVLLVGFLQNLVKVVKGFVIRH